MTKYKCEFCGSLVSITKDVNGKNICEICENSGVMGLSDQAQKTMKTICSIANTCMEKLMANAPVYIPKNNSNYEKSDFERFDATLENGIKIVVHGAGRCKYCQEDIYWTKIDGKNRPINHDLVDVHDCRRR